MAKRYWVGTTGNWNTTSNWSDTSGGAGGSSAPTSTDDVYFDANSNAGTATLVANTTVANLYMEEDAGCTLAISNYKLTVNNTCIVESTNSLESNSSGNVTLQLGTSSTSGNFYFAENSTDLDRVEISHSTAGDVYISGNMYCEWITTINTSGTDNIIFSDFFADLLAFYPEHYCQFYNTWMYRHRTGTPSQQIVGMGETTDKDGNDFHELNVICATDNANVSGIGIAGRGRGVINKMVMFKDAYHQNLAEIREIYLVGGELEIINTVSKINKLFVGKKYIPNEAKKYNNATYTPQFFMSDLFGSNDTLTFEEVLVDTAGMTTTGSSVDLDFNLGSKITVSIGKLYARATDKNIILDIGLNVEIGHLDVRDKFNGTAVIYFGTNGTNVNLGVNKNWCLVDSLDEVYFSGGTVNVRGSGVYGGTSYIENSNRQREAFIKITRKDGTVTDNVYLDRLPTTTNKINDLPEDLQLELSVDSNTYNSENDYTTGNQVTVYVVSRYSEAYPVYRGDIVSSMLDYRTGRLSLTIRHASHQMKKIIATSDGDEVYSQTTNSGSIHPIGGDAIITFTTDAGATFVDSIVINWYLYNLHSGGAVEFVLYPTLADAKADTNSIKSLHTANFAELSKLVAGQYSIPLSEAFAVTPSTDYFIRLKRTSAGISLGPPYFWIRGKAQGSNLSLENNGGTWIDQTFSPYMLVSYSNEVTEFQINDEDLRTRIKTTLQQFQAKGDTTLQIPEYALASIEKTVTYTSVNSSIYNLITKIIESTADDSIYWYVDPATNIFWLLQEQEEPTVYLNSNSVTDLIYKQDITNQVNKIYFVGKDSGAGNYYKVFESADSQGEFGLRAETIIDKRVNTDETASAVANYEFSKRAEPVETIQVTIEESPNQDIDNIYMNDRVSLVNLQGMGRVYLDIDEVDDIFASFDPAKIYDRTVRVVSIRNMITKIMLELNQPTYTNNVLKRQQQQISSIALENNPSTPS